MCVRVCVCVRLWSRCVICLRFAHPSDRVNVNGTRNNNDDDDTIVTKRRATQELFLRAPDPDTAIRWYKTLRHAVNAGSHDHHRHHRHAVGLPTTVMQSDESHAASSSVSVSSGREEEIDVGRIPTTHHALLFLKTSSPSVHLHCELERDLGRDPESGRGPYTVNDQHDGHSNQSRNPRPVCANEADVDSGEVVWATRKLERMRAHPPSGQHEGGSIGRTHILQGGVTWS
jgi:hypothetical protein